jgi:hypothetical protein
MQIKIYKIYIYKKTIRRLVTFSHIIKTVLLEFQLSIICVGAGVGHRQEEDHGAQHLQDRLQGEHREIYQDIVMGFS